MIFKAEVPMTPQALRPNVKVHWAKKSKIVKQMRTISEVTFRKMIRRYEIQPVIPLRQIEIKRIFIFKTKRRRDKDNLNASTKSINDGLVDSGLIVDDCGNNIIWVDSEIKVDKSIEHEFIIYEIQPN